MKKSLKAIVLSAAIVISSLSVPSIDAAAAAPNFTEDYFGIGFDSDETDRMEKSDGWSNGGMFDCTWDASNVNFSGGKMNLSIYRDWRGGYTGGEYRTRQTFGYGMYDVSMKPIKNDGVVTSFFTYTGPTDGTVWDEIDIEFLGKDTTKVQFNYYTSGAGDHEYLYDLGFDASQSYHQYGFYWDRGSITWYVDKKPVYTATRDIPSTPGKIMMNVWPGKGVDEWLNRYNGVAPLTGSYDWISYTKPAAASGGSLTAGGSNSQNISGESGDMFSCGQLYAIRSKNSGKALDVSWGSKDNGANVLQYTYHGYANQKWYIEKQPSGYYTIKCYASGKVLDVARCSSDNGANVQQWEYHNGENQEWSIENVGGYYKFINRKSGKALDVSGRSVDDNANILQWNYSGQSNQLWSISPVQ